MSDEARSIDADREYKAAPEPNATSGLGNPSVTRCRFCGDIVPLDRPYVWMPERWMVILAHVDCYVERMMTDRHARITKMEGVT